MQTLLTVLGALALAVAGWWWWASQPQPAAVEVEALAPEVLAVEFPTSFPADGEPVDGVVRFRAPGAALVHAAFEVEAAGLFVPFGFDPEVGQAREGAFAFYLATVVPQHVTLRVVLTDAQGRTSTPYAFSFSAEMVQEEQAF